MQAAISYRCIESYQSEVFAGNPYETAYRKMDHQCLCSLLAGWGAEVPFGGGEVDSKPVVVSSRLAQLIASGENRALTCLVLRVISDNAKHQGIPFLHTRQSFKILTVPATPQRNGVLCQEARSMEEMSLTHVRQSMYVKLAFPDICIISMHRVLVPYLSDTKIFKQWLNLAYVPYATHNNLTNIIKTIK